MASPDWDNIVDTMKRDRPSLSDPEWASTIASHMDEDVLGAIIADIIKVEDSTHGRGVRTIPSERVALARLQDLRNGGFTTQPFALAMRHITAGRSLRGISAKTGISRSQAHRLLTGACSPTVPEMKAIAEAYGRNPWYFAEWRVQMITAAISDYLAEQPEHTIHLTKRMLR
ncbi:MAG: helix-turn-helix transcriptional regulator [Acidimicrobiales bacterium]|jgi:transcriptional regulator with XRE-family HTH domain|nr:helix-turn-helix transcriptional regulator [Acidimicrobiales bacterium]